MVLSVLLITDVSFAADLTICVCRYYFLICFPMDYRDFSVKSKVIISLFQIVRLSLSIFTVCKFVLSLIKYHCSLLIRFQLAKCIVQ